MVVTKIEELLQQEMLEVKGGTSGTCECTSGAHQSKSDGGVCKCDSKAEQIDTSIKNPGDVCLCSSAAAQKS
jgi:hypothetical protein